MIRIPFSILWLLPKSVQEWETNRIWDAKSDAELITARDENLEMVRNFKTYKDRNPILYSIATDCQKKLDERILPQLRKRGISSEPNQT